MQAVAVPVTESAQPLCQTKQLELYIWVPPYLACLPNSYARPLTWEEREESAEWLWLPLLFCTAQPAKSTAEEKPRERPSWLAQGTYCCTKVTLARWVSSLA